MTHDTADLRRRFAELRAQGRRHKDAAEALGLSEGAAIAAHAGTHDGALQAVPLAGPWLGLLRALEACGPLLALTRNRSTVHEKTGVYQKLSGSEAMGLALGADIDLRLFFGQWHSGFAVTEQAPGSTQAQQSLQFFAPDGTAVHKVFAREATDRAALQAVVDAHRLQGEPPAFRAAEPRADPRDDAAIDTAGFLRGWAGMQDTHEFFGLLKDFGVERRQAFRLAEGRFTRRVGTDALQALLEEAAFDGTPVMVFVGSPGCIQIHTGPVRRVEPLAVRGMRWLNVLDEGFNLHLREDLVAQAWVVEKPTSDGLVTAVEAFDDQGEPMAMFFGARKPGQPELQAWRRIVRGLPSLAAEATP